MRALCGAIITAGALIGLGLTGIGIGLRYQTAGYHPETREFVKLHTMDTSFLLLLTVLGIVLLIGLGVAFVGLAYHHHRRYHEMTRGHTPPAAPPAGTSGHVTS